MMMTMEEEYRRESELFPSPERLEKVSYLLHKIMVNHILKIHFLNEQTSASDTKL